MLLGFTLFVGVKRGGLVGKADVFVCLRDLWGGEGGFFNGLRVPSDLSLSVDVQLRKYGNHVAGVRNGSVEQWQFFLSSHATLTNQAKSGQTLFNCNRVNSSQRPVYEPVPCS